MIRGLDRVISGEVTRVAAGWRDVKGFTDNGTTYADNVGEIGNFIRCGEREVMIRGGVLFNIITWTPNNFSWNFWNKVGEIGHEFRNSDYTWNMVLTGSLRSDGIIIKSVTKDWKGVDGFGLDLRFGILKETICLRRTGGETINNLKVDMTFSVYGGTEIIDRMVE